MVLFVSPVSSTTSSALTSATPSTSAPGSGSEDALKTSKSTPVGAIVGGVVGGVAVILAVALLIWWIRRRQTKSFGPFRQADPEPRLTFTGESILPHQVAPYRVPNSSMQALMMQPGQPPVRQPYSNVVSAYPPPQHSTSVVEPSVVALSHYAYSNSAPSAPSESDFGPTSPGSELRSPLADRKNPHLYTEGRLASGSGRSPDVMSPLTAMEELDAGPAPLQFPTPERIRNPPSYNTVFTNRSAST